VVPASIRGSLSDSGADSASRSSSALPEEPGQAMPHDLAHQMAERLVAFRDVGASDELVSVAQDLITDLIAVTLSGADTDPSRRMRAVVKPDGNDALVLGTAARAGVLDAALLNGTAAHAEDFDDFNEAFGGHPSVAVVPALLALAEARALSGRVLIDAYVAGVEAESRLADAVHFVHYEKGWHPTSTLGVFGAAAGAAHLLNLNTKRTATALAIAASLSSGIKANFGADTKPMHAGHCNRAGLMAALLAEQDFSAGTEVLEGPQGFLRVYNGEGNFNVERLLGQWFDPPALLNPGVSIKQFPCCGSTHAAVYAAFELLDTHGFKSCDVARVDVEVHPRRLPHTNNPEPETPLEAKFSVQYITARALMDGRVEPEHFEATSYNDAMMRDLTARVHARPADDYAARDDRGFAARVAVTLNDGTRHQTENLREPGRGPQNPMSEEEIKAKFTACARRVLTDTERDAVWGLVRNFADIENIGSLASALTPRAVPPGMV
jgi:2-methylcitrate dehydratase PrpD